MKTELVPTIACLRGKLTEPRRQGLRIGLVPTMGALHEGHGSLMDQARRECDVVIVSIFVNPIQFNQASDFERYPRSIETDMEFCRQRKVDFVFAPDAKEMYPAPLDTHVDVGRLTDHLCGANRPGHFRGVATVVTKLFLIALPDRAYFGEKDAQQLAVIERMARDLNIPVQVVPVPIVREADGLAMSSRNKHLSAEERKAATVLYRALVAAQETVKSGARTAESVRRAALAVFATEPGVKVEYFEVVDPAEMQPVEAFDVPVRAAVAAWAGETRLIDNLLLIP